MRRTECQPLRPGRSRAWAGALLAVLAAASPARADERLWDALRQGGQVVLVRHAATVPGVGDPPGFRLGDCGSQRNLSTEGRAQATRLGADFRHRAIAPAEVLTSRWCRCQDTARLAFGTATPWPALDSFFGDPERSDAQTRAVRQRIAGFRGGGTLVLVTHQVNITALTGLAPAPGELVVVTPTPEGGRVLGRIPATAR